MTEAAKVVDALAQFDAIDKWPEFAALALQAPKELVAQIAEIAERKFDSGRKLILQLRTAAKPEPVVEQKVIDWAAERARRERAFATLAAEAEEEPEPEPEQTIEEAEEEPEAEGPLVRFSNEMPEAHVHPTLSPAGPYDSAKEYVRRKCFQEGSLATYFWQEQFWEWNGRHYEVVEERVMRDRVYAFLDESKKRSTGDGEQRFRPKPSHVNDVLDGLKSGLVLGAKYLPPMWFETGERATDVLAFRNGLVNVLTHEPIALSPRLWLA